MAIKLSSTPREWFRITCQADPAVAEIYVYDVIGADPWTGEGVSAKTFLDAIQALPDTVKNLRVHVNSPGGSVFDAVAIANMLRAQSQEKGRTVETLIEGLAASAASIITCAGDSIKIASNAMMMIHNPAGLVMGQASDMRSMADTLDSIRGSIVATYRWVSQLSADAIQTLMDASTWMSAEEALANGFVTEIMGPIKVTACFRPEVVATLGEIPEPYREQVAALTAKAEEKTEPEAALERTVTLGDRSVTTRVEGSLEAVTAAAAVLDQKPVVQTADVPGILAECKAAGCMDLAEELIEAKATREQAKVRATVVLAERKADADRCTEIRGLCATAKLPDLADGYIKARMPVADVKTHLTTITAKMDAVEITTTLPVNGAGKSPGAKTGLTTAEVYRLRAETAARARAGQRGA